MALVANYTVYAKTLIKQHTVKGLAPYRFIVDYKHQQLVYWLLHSKLKLLLLLLPVKAMQGYDRVKTKPSMEQKLGWPNITRLFGSNNQHSLKSPINDEVNHDFGFAATWFCIKGCSIFLIQLGQSLELVFPRLCKHFKSVVERHINLWSIVGERGQCVQHKQ